MRLIFEKGKWNDKRDTPQASLVPCRLHFLLFSAFHAEKAALLRRKMQSVEPQASRAAHFRAKQKAIPYGMTFVLVEISGIEPLTS